MFGHMRMRVLDASESIRLNGVKSFLRELIYRGREAIIVMKDLNCDLPDTPLPRDGTLACINISRPLLNERSIFYKHKGREFRAAHYLDKGYRGFGLLKGKEIIADTWYYSPSFSVGSPEPDELRWLGIGCPKNHAYAFGLFLEPEMRGQNRSFYFQIDFLRHLREQNVVRVYGFYWADNIPASWAHRLTKWKVLKRVKVNRFITIIRSTASNAPRIAQRKR